MNADTGSAEVAPSTANQLDLHEKKQLATQQLLKARVAALTKDPQFRTVTLATAGGAVTFSAVGGAFGCATGIFAGSLAGVLPAIFTLGLSIPGGGALGGTVGLVIGATAGGATGAAGGGMVGYGGHKYRNEISGGLIHIKTNAHGGLKCVNLFVHNKADDAKKEAARFGRSLRFKVNSRAGMVGQGLKERASKLEPHHAMIGGAGAGAVAGGSAGGGVGAVAGGGIGAAVGLIPAIFTLGLSIPVCAVIGGGIGLGVGTAAGGTGGAVVGGAAGFGGHKYRKEIGDGASGLRCRLASSVGSIKVKATQARGIAISATSKRGLSFQSTASMSRRPIAG